ncbi:MAG: GDSL-type esterase/lipase family protein [Bacteroidota bacterium]|nr:GDSL-type esterase/lipase family protein [Bacteroidota bacterium]
MQHPIKTLAALASLFLILGLMAFVYPKAGISLGGGVVLKFPELAELLHKKQPKKDISKILALADKINANDSIAASDSPQTKDTTAIKLINTIQFRNKESLDAFFDALSIIKSDPKSIRVLHYGDSQIECDRITDYLRMKLQSQFGGNGPGFVSLMPISQSITNKVVNGYGWDRYQTFTSKDKRVKHNNFGFTGGFTRFTGYKTITDTSVAVSTNVIISTTKLAGTNNLGYKKIKLFYGGSQTKTWCEFYDGPALSSADSLEKGGNFNIKEYSVATSSHEFKFKGKDSPDFYGISLESGTGVYVDNIPQRGSSGTFFQHINFSQLKSFYDNFNVKLIVLQYGGNALPSLKSKENVTNFANYFNGQIAIIKRAAPNASILFIGPADMGVKEGTEYITHPMLEDTRNALREVAFKNGCAFFDMYDCMGGSNSMSSWVDEKLAAADYIHFSPQGARKIATLLYSSLITNYNNYVKTKLKK